MYTPKTRIPIHKNQTLTELKREIDDLKIIVGDFNTPINNV